MQQPPQENSEIFTLLYFIETALRELIIETLSMKEGQKWYRKCLPSDILDKYRRSRETEKHIRWTQFIPHHPIYYVDFPDLKKIIEREDNWRKAFERFFSRKDVLSSALSEIEPIRNKIAHNRKASSRDVEVVRGVHSLLSTTVGESYFKELSSKCTLAIDIPEKITQLKVESEESLFICCEYQPLNGLNIWYSIYHSWWFDETYLCEKIDKIIEYFRIIDEYSRLPRYRGSGHKIEAWVKNSNINLKYSEAKSQFDVILAT